MISPEEFSPQFGLTAEIRTLLSDVIHPRLVGSGILHLYMQELPRRLTAASNIRLASDPTKPPTLFEQNTIAAIPVETYFALYRERRIEHGGDRYYDYGPCKVDTRTGTAIPGSHLAMLDVEESSSNITPLQTCTLGQASEILELYNLQVGAGLDLTD